MASQYFLSQVPWRSLRLPITPQWKGCEGQGSEASGVTLWMRDGIDGQVEEGGYTILYDVPDPDFDTHVHSQHGSVTEIIPLIV